MLKGLVVRNYRRFAPALDLAGRAYRRGVLSYDAYDDHNRAVEAEIAEELGQVLSARGNLELWAYARRFESRFAAWCGRTHGIGTASGTAALQIALVAAGIGPGDEVITSAHTFIATVLAIHNTGARPVLVDPNPGDLTMSAEAVRRALTSRTRAVIPVHMHGHVADIPGILRVAQEHGLRVIEDCAQAHGATLHGAPVPIGGTGCFSFFASKPLGGAGNGGMIVTDDAALAERCDRARDPEGNDSLVLAAARTPSYIDALEAALLTARLPRLPAWQALRAENAAYYRERLGDLRPVLPRTGVGSAWYSFVVRLPDRDRVKTRMLARGVETRIEYHPSLLTSPTLSALGWRAADFPVATEAALHGLSLPVHPFLSVEDRQRVVDALRAG